MEGNDGGGETILVHGLKASGCGYDEEKRNGYVCAEFHKVDLKEEGGKVEKNFYPELVIWSGRGKMLRAGPKMYLVGGLMEEKGFKCERAAVLNKDKGSWEYVPLPTKRRSLISRYAVLDRKIYHLAHRNSYPAEFNMDPKYGGVEFWEFIWLDDCRVLGGMAPDPANSRILVNLYPGNLYAYYPAGRRMELVGEGVYPWSAVIAVADDIVYVHDPNPEESTSLLYAFDLSKGGKPLDVVWTSTLFQGVIIDGVSCVVDFNSFQSFYALLHVANTNFFWLAAWSWSDATQENTRLFFIKFQASRCSIDTYKIICTPISIRTPLLESTCEVYDFLLLQD